MLETSALKLLATGGQADIYEIDAERLLRLMRNPADTGLVDYEMAALKAVKAVGLSVPEVYERVTIEGRPGFYLERIEGRTMEVCLKQTPWALRRYARLLGVLHMRLGEVKAPEPVMEAKKKARYCIGKSILLTEDLRGFALDQLESLPEGVSLCHGDFHPANIIMRGGEGCIIDWVAAARGDIVSDVAHTYLLMRNLPRLQGTPETAYRVAKLATGLMSRTYLAACQKLRPIDWKLFSKWLVVRAAERTFFGMTSEKTRLMEFIGWCREQERRGRGAQEWWRWW